MIYVCKPRIFSADRSHAGLRFASDAYLTHVCWVLVLHHHFWAWNPGSTSPGTLRCASQSRVPHRAPESVLIAANAKYINTVRGVPVSRTLTKGMYAFA